jgi:hypothetical protein
MRANHWIRVAALAAALGMTGAATAQTTDRATAPDTDITAATGEPPAAGAIVMPQDRAMLNDAMRGEPTGASRPFHPDEVAPLEDNEATPARTGSEVLPGDMGPTNMRGE